MVSKARIFGDGAKFLGKNPVLFLLHLLGWVPSLVLLTFVVLWRNDLLNSMCYLTYMDSGVMIGGCPAEAVGYGLAGVTDFLGRMFLLFLLVLVIHLNMATLISGSSVKFISRGIGGKKASLVGAVKSLDKGKYFGLLKAKALIWLFGLFVSFLAALLVAFALVRFDLSSVFLLLVGVVVFVVGTVLLEIMNNFVAPVVVVEGKDSWEAVKRSFEVFREQMTGSMLIFLVFVVVSVVVSMVLFGITLVMELGPFVGNVLWVVLGTYFVCVWVLFYFRFVRKS